MKITLELSTDESIAPRRLTNSVGCSTEEAMRAALRDWLIGCGHLERPLELAADTETMGET